MDPNAGLDAMAKRKVPVPVGTQTPVVLPNAATRSPKYILHIQNSNICGSLRL